MFADDLLLFYKATKEKAEAIHEAKSTYEEWSGQKDNKQKSGIFFSPNAKGQFKASSKSALNL